MVLTGDTLVDSIRVNMKAVAQCYANLAKGEVDDLAARIHILQECVKTLLMGMQTAEGMPAAKVFSEQYKKLLVEFTQFYQHISQCFGANSLCEIIAKWNELLERSKHIVSYEVNEQIILQLAALTVDLAKANAATDEAAETKAKAEQAFVEWQRQQATEEARLLEELREAEEAKMYAVRQLENCRKGARRPMPKSARPTSAVAKPEGEWSRRPEDPGIPVPPLPEPPPAPASPPNLNIEPGADFSVLGEAVWDGTNAVVLSGGFIARQSSTDYSIAIAAKNGMTVADYSDEKGYYQSYGKEKIKKEETKEGYTKFAPGSYIFIHADSIKIVCGTEMVVKIYNPKMDRYNRELAIYKKALAEREKQAEVLKEYERQLAEWEKYTVAMKAFYKYESQMESWRAYDEGQEYIKAHQKAIKRAESMCQTANANLEAFRLSKRDAGARLQLEQAAAAEVLIRCTYNQSRLQTAKDSLNAAIASKQRLTIISACTDILSIWPNPALPTLIADLETEHGRANIIGDEFAVATVLLTAGGAGASADRSISVALG
jgi:hypothetical protein